VEFETFRFAVEKLLRDFDEEYEKNVYEPGKS